MTDEQVQKVLDVLGDRIEARFKEAMEVIKATGVSTGITADSTRQLDDLAESAGRMNRVLTNHMTVSGLWASGQRFVPVGESRNPGSGLLYQIFQPYYR